MKCDILETEITINRHECNALRKENLLMKKTYQFL